MRRSVALMTVLGLAVTLSSGAAGSWLFMTAAEPSTSTFAAPPTELFLGSFPPTERGWPIFADVTHIVVHRAEFVDGHLGAKSHVELDDVRLHHAAACLEETRELGEPLGEPPRDDVVLFEITDRYGDRMFELLSDHMLTGGRDRRFWSPCLSAFAPVR